MSNAVPAVDLGVVERLGDGYPAIRRDGREGIGLGDGKVLVLRPRDELHRDV